MMDYDDMVDKWLDSAGCPDGVEISLREYLGMTPEEFQRWVWGA